MKSIKKILAVLLVLCMTVSLAACSGSDKETEAQDNTDVTTPDAGDEVSNDTGNDEADATEVTEPEEEVVDLGGIEITIGDWWSSADQARRVSIFLEQ